jgi:hypothetical protein
LKLPKGIKRMRISASEEGLENALSLARVDAFNGYIRTTAPKGVKEASVVIFMAGKAGMAVFQSPQRSLYGPDALHEVKRIVKDPKATIRVEEFLAQNLEDVQVIMNKMRKARVEAIDVERVLMGVEVEVEAELEAELEETRDAEEKIADSIDRDLEEEMGTAGAEETPPVEDETPEEAPSKAGAVRAKVADRITRSKEASTKEDDEFLRMMKEAGMATPSEEDDPVDDEVKQYIDAFEDFIQRSGDEEAVDVTEQVVTTVDDIIDEMLEAAADDPEMMEFIESQREKVLARVASTVPATTARERHDQLSEQQVALEHISSTFSEVLAASEAEAERRRQELEHRREEDDAEADLLEDEAKGIEEEEERQTGLQSILERVMETHKERLDEAQMEMLDEEAEIEAEALAEEEQAREELDLEGAKEEFLEEMRSRIQSVANGPGEPPEAGKVADAVSGTSEDIQERVDELEEEHDQLEREQKVIESEAQALQERVDSMSVDLEVEVQARLRDLEEKEAELRERSAESQELERRLETEREKVEKDLAKARAEIERVEGMERSLEEREELLVTKEKELDGKHEEVEGLKTHLEEEIAVRATELEEMETKLREQEKELLAKEKEIQASVEAVKKEREEGVESDLKRVEELEEELRKREADYTDTISTMENVVDALREELRDNIEKVEALEAELVVLRETEERVRELEEQLASMPEDGEGASDMDKEELRKLLAYLDDLLSKLPEKEIEKFSKTEYFELYGRILDRLGI